MGEKRIGVHVAEPDSRRVLESIKAAEALGISAAWMTTGGAGMDALTLFAAAAAQTLGTSIVPTFPRHPIAMVQQVQVFAQLAPGRFRLGVGPSHRPTMVGSFGVDFRSPLGHLKEYVHILRSLLHTGSVDFQGRYYTARAEIPGSVDVPVMASALRTASFEMCGEAADGAISWVCPGVYLRDEALPAITRGASASDREAPPLIAHVPVCVHDDVDEVRAAMRGFGRYPQLPFYQQMFAAAGYPEAVQGAWSDGMIDGVALYGSETQVGDKLMDLLNMGAGELLVSPVAAGPDREASLDRTLRTVGDVSRSLSS
ncbi:MAG: LLM class flavin-dependent oxidoreductase [Dehalococcoidia bacterium]|nr:LLM class flavin-dependent oxidoreductase [Dehalococcoidia bacterium]